MQTGVKQSIVSRGYALAFLFVCGVSGAAIDLEGHADSVCARRPAVEGSAATTVPSREAAAGAWLRAATSTPTTRASWPPRCRSYRVAWDPSVVEEETVPQGSGLAGVAPERTTSAIKPRRAYRRKLVNSWDGANDKTKLPAPQPPANWVNYQAKKRDCALAGIPGQPATGAAIIFEKVDRRFLPFGSLAQPHPGLHQRGPQRGAGIEYTFNDKQLAGHDGAGNV